MRRPGQLARLPRFFFNLALRLLWVCFYSVLFLQGTLYKELTSNIQVVFFFQVFALMKTTSENPFPGHENVPC